MRVWQSRSDANALYISARPEGGSWGTLGTIPLDMSGVSSSGVYRYGDIALAVPLAEQAPTECHADYWQEQAEWFQTAANLALDQRDACYADLRAARAQTCDLTEWRAALATARQERDTARAQLASCSAQPRASSPCQRAHEAAMADAARLGRRYTELIDSYRFKVGCY